ncbi:hypothetical protein [Leptospira sp. 'Mane']|uniref:hypothetical protein n=1 Tax=Leptospira sp. 'Mane' TaxID=3387407 RepID=UPI00398AF141
MKPFVLILFLGFVFTSTTWAVPTYKEGDRVEVLELKDGKYYSGVIKKIQKDGFLIHYDGYADSFDEVVVSDRLKSMSQIEGVSFIQSEKRKAVTVTGNLNSGHIMEDLEWAESSSMACWPGIRNIEFEGKQVFYWTDLPKKSELKITVKPKDPKKRINLYAFSGFDPKYIPPKVYGAVSCEASHPTWIGQPDFSKPSEPQSVELRAVGNPYRVFIAVSGAKDALDGEYELIIDLK